MATRRGILAGVAGLAASAGLAQPAQAQDTGQTGVVERLHAALTDIMQNAAGLGYQGRRDQLAGILPGIFSFPLMARIVAGSHWESFSDEQRASLVATYRDLSIATYANRFDGYSGERFLTGSSQEVRGGSFLVHTQLLRPADTPVEINYVVRQVSGDWRIVDVLLDGNVSEVSRQRSEYASVLGQGGHAALISALQASIARQGG